MRTPMRRRSLSTRKSRVTVAPAVPVTTAMKLQLPAERYLRYVTPRIERSTMCRLFRGWPQAKIDPAKRGLVYKYRANLRIVGTEKSAFHLQFNLSLGTGFTSHHH
jgi:hypothetical protein